jgi:octaprenyl-diphosphate synthase
MNLGIAYQIYDDCVDLFATELAAGKSLGTDLAKGKLTLPLLLLLERLPGARKKQLQEMIEHWSAKHLKEIQQLLDAHGALAASRRVIDRYLDAARQDLQVLPNGANRAGLAGLTDFLAQQANALGGLG